jgi:hypothetical protein
VAKKFGSQSQNLALRGQVWGGMFGDIGSGLGEKGRHVRQNHESLPRFLAGQARF